MVSPATLEQSRWFSRVDGALGRADNSSKCWRLEIHRRTLRAILESSLRLAIAAESKAMGASTPHRSINFNRAIETAFSLNILSAKELVEAIHRNVHFISRRTARSQINDILELIGRLAALEMRPHASVMAPLLPTESRTIKAAIELGGNPAVAAELLESSRKADPHFFTRSLASDTEFSMVEEAIKYRISSGLFRSPAQRTFINCDRSLRRQLPRLPKTDLSAPPLPRSSPHG